MMMARPHKRWADRLGLVLAVGCGLHCATLTVLFLSFPTLWLNRHYCEIGLWQKLLVLEWSLLTAAWLMMLLSIGLRGMKGRRLPTLTGLSALIGMSILVVTPAHFANPWVGLGILGCGVVVGITHCLRLRPI